VFLFTGYRAGEKTQLRSTKSGESFQSGGGPENVERVKMSSLQKEGKLGLHGMLGEEDIQTDLKEKRRFYVFWWGKWKSPPFQKKSPPDCREED